MAGRGRRADPRATDRQRQILELRRQRWSYSAIAEHLGIGEATAVRLGKAAIDEVAERNLETAAQVLAIEEEILEEGQKLCISVIRDEEAKIEVRMAAIDRVCRLNERRARLRGLDKAAPREDPDDQLRDALLSLVTGGGQ